MSCLQLYIKNYTKNKHVFILNRLIYRTLIIKYLKSLNINSKYLVLINNLSSLKLRDKK